MRTHLRSIPACLALMLCLAWHPQPAHAGVIVEVASGDPPTAATQHVETIIAELSNSKFRAAPSALRQGDGVPYPGTSPARPTVDSIREQIASGYNAWMNGEIRVAEQQFAAGMKLVWENPAIMVAAPDYSDMVYRAQVGLALTRSRTGDVVGATADMLELIRTMPDKRVDKKAYGPEAEALYTLVRKQADKLERGKLIIDASRADTQIFINGIGRARGVTYSSAVLPGRYHVFVQIGNEGRRYQVSVRPNEQTRLSIDWEAHAVLQAMPTIMRLRLPEAQAANATGLAARYMRSIGLDDRALIVLGHSRTHLSASLYSIDSGKTVRAGRIKLPGSIEHARALARYLVQDPGSYAGVEVTQGEGAPAPAPESAKASPPAPAAPSPTVPTTPPALATDDACLDGDADCDGEVDAKPTANPQTPTTVPWLALGGGIAGGAAVGVGAYLIAIDGTPTCDGGAAACPTLHQTKTVGFVTVGLGVAALSASAVLVYVWATEPDRPAHVLLAPHPDGAMAYAAWRW